MGTFVVTGSASGMGRAACERLEAAGHRVIGVDLAAATVTADLGTSTGRRSAAARVAELAGAGLDGAVLAAGLGPAPGRAGAVLTPLLERQLASPGEGRRIRAFPVPTGGYGAPD